MQYKLYNWNRAFRVETVLLYTKSDDSELINRNNDIAEMHVFTLGKVILIESFQYGSLTLITDLAQGDHTLIDFLEQEAIAHASI